MKPLFEGDLDSDLTDQEIMDKVADTDADDSKAGVAAKSVSNFIVNCFLLFNNLLSL